MTVLLELLLGWLNAARRGDFLPDLHNNYSFRSHSCVLAWKILLAIGPIPFLLMSSISTSMVVGPRVEEDFLVS